MSNAWCLIHVARRALRTLAPYEKAFVADAEQLFGTEALAAEVNSFFSQIINMDSAIEMTDINMADLTKICRAAVEKTCNYMELDQRFEKYGPYDYVNTGCMQLTVAQTAAALGCLNKLSDYWRHNPHYQRGMTPTVAQYAVSRVNVPKYFDGAVAEPLPECWYHEPDF